jgi:hypothetical protein
MKTKTTKKNSSILNTLLNNVEHRKNKRLATQTKESKKVKQAKMDNQGNIDYKEAKLKADILQFNEEKYIVIENNDINYIVPETTISEGIYRKSWKTDVLQPFFAINSISMFETLTESINQTFNNKISCKKVEKSTSKYYKDVDLLTTIQFLGLYILAENEYKKNTDISLEDNFRSVRNNNNNLKDIDNNSLIMGVRRFLAIKRNIIPDNEAFDELIDIWTTQSKHWWTPGSNVTVDESIFAYEVRKDTKTKLEKLKDPVPCHYIPSKPHPNGLFAFVEATKSFNTNQPYVLDMLPHYR